MCSNASFGCIPQTLDSVWVDADHGADDEGVKLLDNPSNLFRILKQFGVKVTEEILGR